MPEIHLKVYRSPSEFRTETYGQPRVSVGREVNNDIVVPEKGISRFHCAFECDEHGWRIVDLESTNGTFVNGISVKKATLKSGDVVVVGSVRLHVLECASSASPTAPRMGNYHIVQTFDARGPVRIEQCPPSDSATVKEMQRLETAAAPHLSMVPILLVDTTTEILRAAHEPHAAAKTLASRVMAVVQADLSAVYLCNPETHLLECAAVEPDGVGSPVTTEILDYVRAQSMAVQVEMDDNVAVQTGRPRAVICVPLLDGRELLGAIALVRRRTSWKAEDTDAEMLSVVATSAAAALAVVRSRNQLEEAYLELLGASESLPASLGERLEDRAEAFWLDAALQKTRGALARVLEKSAALAEQAEGDPTREAQIADLIEAARQSAALTEQLSSFVQPEQGARSKTWPVALLNECLPVLRELGGAVLAINERVPNELPAVVVGPRVLRAALVRAVLYCRDRMGAARLTLTAALLGSEKPIVAEGCDEIPAGQYVVISIEAEGEALPTDELAVLRDKENGALRDPRSPVAGLYWAARMLRRSTARLIARRLSDRVIALELYLPVLA